MAPEAGCLNSTPISIVIPSMNSPRTKETFPWLLTVLLQSDLFRHPHSEVLINHGSNESFAARTALEARVRSLIGRTPPRGFPPPDPNRRFRRHADGMMQQLTHSYGPRPELFAASRFYAAARARNDIIVSMDDDVLPFQSQLALTAALACAVYREEGFPHPAEWRAAPTTGPQFASEARTSPRPAMYSPQERHCDANGYSACNRQNRL